jgi:hypothetical protein
MKSCIRVETCQPTVTRKESSRKRIANFTKSEDYAISGVDDYNAKGSDEEGEVLL